MPEAICPYNGEPCEMAQWTVDYLRAQFVVPRTIIPEAICSVISVSMKCEGDSANCEQPSPQELENTVQKFSEALRRPENPAFDYRSEELRQKIEHPIDRALMWTLLLPTALTEAGSGEEELDASAINELARLHEVLSEYYGGHLVLPHSPVEEELLQSLASISLNHLNSSIHLGKGQEVAKDISQKFAEKYIKPKGNDKDERAFEIIKQLRHMQLGLTK